MFDTRGPESTRYDQRQEPGNGWRHRLERRLLAWPIRYRQLLVRREIARCAASGPVLPPSELHAQLRHRGLQTDLLAAYFRLARQEGFSRDDTEGALALIRQLAVQCAEPTANIDTVALAAAAVAMSGQAVHLVSADAAASGQVHAGVESWLNRFGLQAGLIESGSNWRQRRAVYRLPVVVVNAQEAMRDYLEDRLQLRHQPGEISRKLARVYDKDVLQAARMAGLPFGLIVDANRVLIEQACAPMTLAGRTDGAREREWAEVAMALARPLQSGLHFVSGNGGKISLTDAGDFQLQHSAESLPRAWKNNHRRAEAVVLALRALALQIGAHYQVADGKVLLMPAAPRDEGLQQLLEVREGVPVTGQVTVRAKLTYQRFFRRYLQLAALCDDTRHIRGELWQVYGLPCFELSPIAGLERQQESLSAAWRAWRQRRKEQQQRFSLLTLDNQTGSITTFSGRAE